MPIMRGPSGSTYKHFKIPCSGEGIFVAVNTRGNSGYVVYWNGTNYINLASGGAVVITIITVQDGVASVTVNTLEGIDAKVTRVCFIPGDPLASN